jgi:Rrf2 family iron-sulfur cluster assembly transcriptional regulator
MRLSLQVHYAICGVFDLAYNGQGAPVQVRVIGERQEIPARYLEQIFQRLRRAGLVQGKRGPGGGYTLSRSPGEISLLEVVEAVEGPVGGGAGADREGDARPLNRQGPNFLWDELSSRFAEVLERYTLEELCREASQVGVPRSNPDAYVYEI